LGQTVPSQTSETIFSVKRPFGSAHWRNASLEIW